MQNVEKKPIEIEGATVPFFEYTIEETQYLEFDSSKCGPPEPMVNAMAGLKHITHSGIKLVMINHSNPMGLIGKIGQNYEVETTELPEGGFRLLFSYIEGKSEAANLNDASCSGA